MTKDISKELYEQYDSHELLKAFLLHEARFRLQEVQGLNKDAIDKYYEDIADLLFTDIDIFDSELINDEIENYINSNNDSQV